MALDAARKQQMVDIEMGSFYSVTATAKAFTNESAVYGGQTYRIFKDCGRDSIRGEYSHGLEKFHVAATFRAVSSDQGRAQEFLGCRRGRVSRS